MKAGESSKRIFGIRSRLPPDPRRRLIAATLVLEEAVARGDWSEVSGLLEARDAAILALGKLKLSPKEHQELLELERRLGASMARRRQAILNAVDRGSRARRAGAAFGSIGGHGFEASG